MAKKSSSKYLALVLIAFLALAMFWGFGGGAQTNTASMQLEVFYTDGSSEIYTSDSWIPQTIKLNGQAISRILVTTIINVDWSGTVTAANVGGYVNVNLDTLGTGPERIIQHQISYTQIPAKGMDQAVDTLTIHDSTLEAAIDDNLSHTLIFNSAPIVALTFSDGSTDTKIGRANASMRGLTEDPSGQITALTVRIVDSALV